MRLGYRKFIALPLFAFCLALFTVCVSSCKDDDKVEVGQYDPGLPVKVTDISPSTGGIALPVVISGNNFGTDKKKVKLYFDNKEAVIITAQNEHLYAVVPKLKGGEHQVRVVVEDQNEGVLEGKTFDYIVASSVTTVAGLGGDEERVDGPALEAKFYWPYSLAIDDKGNILVSDWGWYIRLVSLESNTVTTLFTSNSKQFYGSAFSPDYSTYYAAIRSTSQTRLAYSFFRNGNWAEGLVMNTDMVFDDETVGITCDDQNSLFTIGYYGSIGKVNRSTGVVELLGTIPDDFHSGVEFSLAFNPVDKYIYISSHWDDVILRFDSRKEKLEEGDVELYAGTPGGASGGLFNGYRLDATFLSPRGLACDSEGNLYIADSGNNAIRMIDPEGNVTTYAGGNGKGSKDGVVENSSFNLPYDVAVSPEGFVYVADCLNCKIRCIAVQ